VVKHQHFLVFLCSKLQPLNKKTCCCKINLCLDRRLCLWECMSLNLCFNFYLSTILVGYLAYVADGFSLLLKIVVVFFFNWAHFTLKDLHLGCSKNTHWKRSTFCLVFVLMIRLCAICICMYLCLIYKIIISF